MMRACPADFARLAGYLGFSCDDDSWVKLRNPLTLAHWTMPVVELLMTLEALKAELGGLDFLHAVEIDRVIHEGRGHEGQSAVVQIVARRG